MMKEKISVIAITSDNVVYGGFIYAKITNHQYCDPETKNWEGIVDSQSFLFTFKNDKPLKFDMKEEKKEQSTVFVEHHWSKGLFSMGNISELQLRIEKKGFQAQCHQSIDSHYDFRGIQSALTGKTGYSDKFDIKRVVVIQFK